MVKTKYERMNRIEKKELIVSYKNTPAGKEMMNRLLRINGVGVLLILYSLYFLISHIKALKWTDYAVSIPIGIIGFFFIFMAYRLKKKVLNQFAIKKKK